MNHRSDSTLLDRESRSDHATGDVVVDGGSNVGFFALLAATMLKGNGRVFAFEAEPSIRVRCSDAISYGMGR